MDTPRQHDTVIRTLAVVDDTSDVPRSTSLKETMVLFPKSAGFPRPRSKSGSSASDKVTLVGALAESAAGAVTVVGAVAATVGVVAAGFVVIAILYVEKRCK